MRVINSSSLLILSLILTFGSGQRMEAANIEQGRRLALRYCSECHAIDKVSPSPLRIAPPFRNLHERYPVETLEEALAEGIMTGHPSSNLIKLTILSCSLNPWSNPRCRMKGKTTLSSMLEFKTYKAKDNINIRG